MLKKTVLYLFIFLLLQTSFSTTDIFSDVSSDNAENSSALNFKSIDLTRLIWHAKRGFNKQDISGFSPDEPDLVKITKFPIIPNSIFKIGAGVKFNHFTLQTQFTLKQKDINTGEPFALFISYIGQNWEIFLNGRLLQREIFLDGKGGISVIRSALKVTIPIKTHFLEDGKNVLVFHLIGQENPASFAINDDLGLYYTDGYMIHTYKQLIEDKAEFFDLALIVIFLFFGLYHIFLYIRMRQVKFNLFFGLFAGILSFYLFSRTSLMYSLAGGIDISLLSRAEYFSLSILIPLFLLFLHDYFYTGERQFLPIKIIIIVSSIIALSYWVMPFRFSRITLKIWQLSALPMLVYTILFISQAIFQKKMDSILMAIGICFAIFSAVWDIFASLLFHSDIRLFQYGFALFVLSLVAIIAGRFVKAHKDSERLNIELGDQKNSFQRFVPVQFLRLLGKESTLDIKLGDTSLRNMSILFSDIRDFTELSESMSPEDNIKFLNNYLIHMEIFIKQCGGFVDKFIGDAIMALFPDSEPGDIRSDTPTSADNAINAAFAMRKELVMYNMYRKNQGYVPIEFGIGINTGQMMLGTVGSLDRIDTTVIGKTVNLASRIEALSKVYKTRIVISDYTYNQISNPDIYHIREVDAVLVKGVSEPVEIYEVYETDEEKIVELKDRTKSLIARGLLSYKMRNFDESLNFFKQARDVFPDDRVAQIYIQRCNKYILKPPPPDWKGVDRIVLRK